MDNINTDNAEGVFAVANTPSFLIRKLIEDDVTNYISKKYSGEKILNELVNISKNKKYDLKYKVLPFVLIVALWKNNDISYLKKASSVSIEDEWFSFCLNILLQTHKGTSISNIHIKAIPRNVIIPSSSAEFNTISIKLDH